MIFLQVTEEKKKIALYFLEIFEILVLPCE